MTQLVHIIVLLMCWIYLGTSINFHGTSRSLRFPCHCSPGSVCVTEQGTDSGNCSLGCDNETLPWAPWSGPGCQVGNVAFSRRAFQGTFSSGASLAVDGQRNHRRSSSGRVSSTEPAWWCVGLGSDHIIQMVYITTVERYEETIDDIIVYVSNSCVSRIYSYHRCVLTPGNLTIIGNCNNMIGRFVSVIGTEDNVRLYLSEVHVHGYLYYECSDMYADDYWFGPGCLLNCHCSTQCDSITGRCDGECKAGFRGDTCQLHVCESRRWDTKCSSTCHCDRCDDDTGSCEGRTCDGGYQGDRCDVPCAAGTWGAGNLHSCPNNCNCRDFNEVCLGSNGSCPMSGCAQWYTGTGCDYAVPRLGTGDAPVRVDGNGRNVTIRFTQWNPQYGGDGQESDIYYMIEYAESDSAQYALVAGTQVHHVSGNNVSEINCTFSELDAAYMIRVVPYENSSSYAGPEEPSPAIVIDTVEQKAQAVSIAAAVGIAFGAAVLGASIASCIAFLKHRYCKLCKSDKDQHSNDKSKQASNKDSTVSYYNTKNGVSPSYENTASETMEPEDDVMRHYENEQDVSEHLESSETSKAQKPEHCYMNKYADDVQGSYDSLDPVEAHYTEVLGTARAYQPLQK